MVDQDPRKQEQLRRWGNLSSFLKKSETKYPNLANQLPNLLSKMLGGQAFDPNLMLQHGADIPVAAAVLGDWLKNSGFVGFSVSLSTVDSLKKGAAKAMVNLPSRDSFFQTSGISSEHWQEMQNAIVDLSGTLSQALEIGYTPKQVVAGLVIDSTVPVGQENSNTFIPARAMMVRASGNKLSQVNQILNGWIQGR